MDSSMNDCSQRTLAVHRTGGSLHCSAVAKTRREVSVAELSGKTVEEDSDESVRFGKRVNLRAASNLRRIHVLRRTRVRRSSDRSSSRPTSKSGLVEMCAEEDRHGSRLPPWSCLSTAFAGLQRSSLSRHPWFGGAQREHTASCTGGTIACVTFGVLRSQILSLRKPSLR